MYLSRINTAFLVSITILAIPAKIYAINIIDDHVQSSKQTLAACAVGEYLFSGNCETCRVGAFCPGDDSVVPCTYGYVNPNEGQSEISACTPCHKDSFTYYTGQSVCNKIDPGMF